MNYWLSCGRFVIFSLTTFVTALLAVTAALGQQSVGLMSPTVTTAARFAVSPPLRSLKPILSKSDEKAEDDIGEPGPVGNTHHDPDPRLQSWIGSGIFSQQGAIPPTAANFAGMTGTAQPPDPNGDIGPNHYVQTVNSKFQIFSRAGVSVFGPANVNTLFTGFGGPCQTENAGDPVVLYD